MDINLDESEDIEIWNFAKENNFTIVTKDADFNEINLIEGFPPKVIWLRVGNCKIMVLEKLIRSNYVVVTDFYNNPISGIIEID